MSGSMSDNGLVSALISESVGKIRFKENFPDVVASYVLVPPHWDEINISAFWFPILSNNGVVEMRLSLYKYLEYFDGVLAIDHVGAENLSTENAEYSELSSVLIDPGNLTQVTSWNISPLDTNKIRPGCLAVIERANFVTVAECPSDIHIQRILCSEKRL